MKTWLRDWTEFKAGTVPPELRPGMVLRSHKGVLWEVMGLRLVGERGQYNTRVDARRRSDCSSFSLSSTSASFDVCGTISEWSLAEDFYCETYFPLAVAKSQLAGVERAGVSKESGRRRLPGTYLARDLHVVLDPMKSYAVVVAGKTLGGEVLWGVTELGLDRNAAGLP